MSNLFEGLPSSAPAEIVDVLASGADVRIERIVSTGQASGQDDWYDQDQYEWVIVLRGEAELEFIDDDSSRRLVRLTTGDYLLILPHEKHRVHWTSPGETTVWLAVFFRR